MGDDSPPPPPPAQIIPAPPSAAELSTASMNAQIAAAPQILAIQKEQMPQYAQLLTDIARTQDPQMAQIALDLKRQFGPQYIQTALDNLKMADPTGFQIRQTLGNKILNELQQGGNLTPEEQQQFEQDIRAGQVQRGVGTGFRESLDEAQILAMQRNQRNQQRIGNAANFLAGRPPEASFGALNAAAQTPGAQNMMPFMSQMYGQFAPSTNALIGSQMQGYNTMANFTGQNNALDFAKYQYVDQNTSNPFLTGLAAFGGFASSIIGGSSFSAGAPQQPSYVSQNQLGSSYTGPDSGEGGGGMGSLMMMA